MCLALAPNLVRITQNQARFLEDFTSTFHNTEVPYSKPHRGFCIKKTLCLFSNDSFRFARNNMRVFDTIIRHTRVLLQKSIHLFLCLDIF